MFILEAPYLAFFLFVRLVLFFDAASWLDVFRLLQALNSKQLFQMNY